MNSFLFSIYTKMLKFTVNIYNEKQLLNDDNILLNAHKKMGKLYWILYLWDTIFLFLNFTQDAFWKVFHLIDSCAHKNLMLFFHFMGFC